MIIVNLFPYFARNNPVSYSWLGMVGAHRLGLNNVLLVGSELQLRPPSQQLHGDWIKDELNLNDEEWRRIKKILVPETVIGSVQYDDALDGLHYFKEATTRVYDEYYNFLVLEFRQLGVSSERDMALQTVNDKTFRSACEKLGLNVMHHEAGPIRYPRFKFGTYFADLSGVNGAHSFDAIVKDVEEEFSEIPILTRQQISYSLYKGEIPWSGTEEIGVALQVEDDSNLIAYSCGYNSLSLLYKALWVFPPDLVLVRDHPLARFKLNSEELGRRQNTSESLEEFLRRAKRLLTINSSVAFDFLVNRRDCYVVGDSPYNAMACRTLIRSVEYRGPSQDRLDFLLTIFLTIYLIPEWLWLNLDYLSFRNSQPSISEIYDYHLKSYKKNEIVWGETFIGMN